MAKTKSAQKTAAKKRNKSAAKTKRKSSRRKRADKRESQGRRPLWTGTLRLALVSVPVKLYTATDSGARISFHQVHKPSGKRVRYQKVVPDIGPVDTDEIVKGFEMDNGRYVLLEPEEIDEVKLEAKSTIDLVQFVRQGEIHPIWFGRPYYIVAEDDEVAEEAYRVLRDAMRSTETLGLGQFVMRGREYIAAIRPCGNGLMLETLRFADEVREAAPYFADYSDDEPDRELLDLAEELIGRKTAKFDPQRFEDRYTEALRELIEAKAKKRKPVEVDEEKPERGAEVVDLVEALKKSVRRGERGKSGSSSGGRRKAG